MSNYQANIITKNPATPTGPNANGSAPGIWRMNEVAYWIKQGVWPNANILTDPYFPYVTLLLSSTSLGNANNNLFVDSSGAFNPISRNGNATQGSFTPYGTNWSNYFASSSDYLQISGPATGTGTWTVEGWFYFTSFPGGPIFAQGTADTTSCWFLYLTSSGGLNFYSNGNISSSAGGVVTANTWVHIALVSNASTATTYVNGTSVASGSYAGKVFTGGPFQLNRGYGGATSGNPCYQSNVRMVVGTAVYTANFTPPTSPLTAISGTTLLTCQSNRFRDASTNNYTVTRTGSVTVTEFAPFSPGYPGITYNQSDITNWSGYFDGSGDYLAVPSTSALPTANQAYTIEAWIYPTTINTNNGVIGWGTYGTTNAVNAIKITSTQIFNYWWANDLAGNFTFTAGQWYHIVAQFDGTTRSLYVNGTRLATDTPTGHNVPSPVTNATIGVTNSTEYFTGSISNVRVITGQAIYSGASFTVPTSPLTAISGTSLLTLQNAAFTDNSTNNFVITPNGNTTVTGNSPFNTVGYWSNYFDGSGDWLSVPDSASLQMGSSDFTYECWLYPTAIPNTYQSFIEKRGVGGYAGVLLAIKSSGKYSILVANSSSSWGIVDETSIDVTLNAWQHLAAVRSGSTFSVYLNGVRLINTTISFSVFDNTSVQGIGAGDSSGNQPFYGYLSNVRIVKGTAVYSGASFTPPTAPLTAISGTSLLTCQNGRFIDNSTNNFTITVNGNTSVQSFDPFYTSTIASNCGSMYFDGSGDYLLTPYSGNTIFGSANFTFEAWIYPTTTSSTCTVAALNNTTSGGAYCAVRIDYTGSTQSASMLISNAANSWQIISGTSSNVVRANSWSHIAVVRNGSSFTLYVNGVSSATGTYSGSINSYGAGDYIGAVWNGSAIEQPFFGYISNLRLVKGTAVYTSAFTPPTAPVTPTAATTLLVNGMNAGIYDATAINDMETVGNAQVSTSVSKFGGSSVYFDGTGDYLTSNAASDLYAFGTGNFTVEMWFNLSSFANLQVLYDSRPTSTDGLYVCIFVPAGGASVNLQVSAATQITGTATLSTGVWYHLALSRSSGSTRMFLNGTQIGSTYADTNAYLNSGTTRPFIGGSSYSAGTLTVNGYIEEVRVTKGYARYTANFTPPTQAFPTY